MRLSLLVLAGFVVVLGGLLEGDAGALVALLALALAALVVLASRAPAGRRRSPLRPVPERSDEEGFPAYNRLYSAVLLSGTSERHVDLTLRPVLLRVLAAELQDHGPEAVRARLGERWWQLVDPGRPAGSDSRAGGLDHPSLLDLLDRLEAHPQEDR